MRLAYFSPLPPQRSGIADYSAELLPHLAASARIDLFVDGFAPAGDLTREGFGLFDYGADPAVLNRLGGYDAVVYHMGNDHRYHGGLYHAALAHPGVVVFHDFALQNFFLGLAHERRDPSLYLDELEACHGAGVRAEAEEVMRRGGAPPPAGAPLSFPLNCRLANAAEVIIVHSEWSRAHLARVAPSVPVTRINLPVIPEDAEQREPARAGGDRRPVEIAAFGHITTEKGIDRTLAALAALGEAYDFRYTLVGQPDNFDVHELVRAHGLESRVHVTGFVTLEEFKERIRGTDIAVNLRERTVGETSASVCRIMAAGVPVLVSDVGWFSELPDDAVVKIDAGEAADSQLRAFLARLITDEPLRRRIGENARRHVLAEHDIRRSARDYLEVLRRAAATRPRRRLVRGVSTELARIGLAPEDENFLRGVAREVARVAPSGVFEESEN